MFHNQHIFLSLYHTVSFKINFSNFRMNRQQKSDVTQAKCFLEKKNALLMFSLPLNDSLLLGAK